MFFFFFFQAEDGIRDLTVTGVQTCALPIYLSVLLSLVGGVLGLVIGVTGVRALLAINPGNIPRIGENGSGVTLDWTVLGFTLLLSLLTGILFGLVPALHGSRADLNSVIKESGARSG